MRSNQANNKRSVLLLDSVKHTELLLLLLLTWIWLWLIRFVSRVTHAKRAPTLASDSLMSLWASLSLSFSKANCADTTHTYTHQEQACHNTDGNKKSTNEGGLDRCWIGTLVNFNRYKTHSKHNKDREDAKKGRSRSLTQLMTMVGQRYIPIMSEWAISCARGRVWCTFTPKTRCNLSSKEHQCSAMTA